MVGPDCSSDVSQETVAVECIANAMIAVDRGYLTDRKMRAIKLGTFNSCYLQFYIYVCVDRERENDEETLKMRMSVRLE